MALAGIEICLLRMALRKFGRDYLEGRMEGYSRL
jgi:hypothetical protein